MNPLGLVRDGRRRAEALMLDTCRIRAITGNSTDPSTGAVTPTYGSVLYQGKCKLQNQRAFPSTPDAGEHQFTTTPNDLHLPVTAPSTVTTGVEITASVAPLNVGRTFRVRSGDRKSLQTAIRFQVEEVTG
jgi:hypothetical protein